MANGKDEKSKNEKKDGSILIYHIFTVELLNKPNTVYGMWLFKSFQI